MLRAPPSAGSAEFGSTLWFRGLMARPSPDLAQVRLNGHRPTLTPLPRALPPALHLPRSWCASGQRDCRSPSAQSSVAVGNPFARERKTCSAVRQLDASLGGNAPRGYFRTGWFVSAMRASGSRSSRARDTSCSTSEGDA